MNRHSDRAGLHGFILGVLFCLLIAWALEGCTPAMTYDEMAEASQDPATPAEERAELEKRIERFDDSAERAQQFYEYKLGCLNTKGLVWYCGHEQSSAGRRMEFRSTEEMIRAWRRDRFACQCMAETRLREAMRGMMWREDL